MRSYANSDPDAEISSTLSSPLGVWKRHSRKRLWRQGRATSLCFGVTPFIESGGTRLPRRRAPQHLASAWCSSSTAYQPRGTTAHSDGSGPRTCGECEVLWIGMSFGSSKGQKGLYHVTKGAENARAHTATHLLHVHAWFWGCTRPAAVAWLHSALTICSQRRRSGPQSCECGRGSCGCECDSANRQRGAVRRRSRHGRHLPVAALPVAPARRA